MEKSLVLDHLTLGVCYYPEQWDESLWEDDLTRMLASGIEVVRVFEFAWSMAEPEEGHYDFAFFDRFLALAAAKGMRVILCTPTATPPAWLTHGHPEVLNADKQGNLMHHGHRRHYNYSSPVYLAYTEKIVAALARNTGIIPPLSAGRSITRSTVRSMSFIQTATGKRSVYSCSSALAPWKH